ncbi:MAG: Glu/Leu/Phe/Val dehydrogenase [Proteobacteria bacterium]|nr:Glu/Leu/Phe/Val dehydrogenase [Pseudomonadota bacterium]
MTDWMTMMDELGPEKILHVYDPETGMKGVVVVHTTMNNIAGGGTRMMPDITTREIFGLARTMTHKFAIFDFPIGGAKAGIWADPGIQGEQRRELTEAFGRAVKPLLTNGITLAADIGTDTEDVESFYKGAEMPSGSTGLAAAEIEGEPLENHATGYGVVVAAKAACGMADIDIGNASAAIEGFGKVGGGAARYLDKIGTKVTAISTLKGTLYNPDGLNVEKLLEIRRTHGDRVVEEYGDGQTFEKEKIYGLPTDILIPGARPYVIDEGNVDLVQAKVVSSIANIPITEKAEEILFRKNVHIVPDFVSNAGGVIVALVDILGGSTDDVFTAIEHMIAPLTENILKEAVDTGINPQKLAVSKTTQKVLQARSGKVALPFEEILDKVKTKLNL